MDFVKKNPKHCNHTYNGEVCRRASKWKCLHSINNWTIKHHVLSPVFVFRGINILSLWTREFVGPAVMTVAIKQCFIISFSPFLGSFRVFSDHFFLEAATWTVSFFNKVSLILRRLSSLPFLIFLSVYQQDSLRPQPLHISNKMPVPNSFHLFSVTLCKPPTPPLKGQPLPPDICLAAAPRHGVTPCYKYERT